MTDRNIPTGGFLGVSRGVRRHIGDLLTVPVTKSCKSLDEFASCCRRERNLGESSHPLRQAQGHMGGEGQGTLAVTIVDKAQACRRYSGVWPELCA